MAKPVKVILVGAKWAPFHGKLKRICERVASEAGVDFEERIEDWVFLTKYGEKDELGGADIPQVFVEYDDGTIVHVMTKVPLNEQNRPDFAKAEELLRAKLSA